MPEPAPPFDPELSGVLASLADRVPPTITPEMIDRFRAIPADPTVGGLVEKVGAVHEQRTIAGYAGGDIDGLDLPPRRSSRRRPPASCTCTAAA